MHSIFENDYDYDELKNYFNIVRDQIERNVRPDPDARVNEEEFFLMLNEIIDAAEKGDVIAQDFIAYMYKRGYYKIIPQSMKIYMQWSVLAAANGNKYTIEKLKIFLTPAINNVCSEPDFEQIAERNGLYLDNFEYVISRLFCQAIVDYLKLEASEMIKLLSTSIKEDFEFEMRVFDKAREAVFPQVMQFLRN